MTGRRIVSPAYGGWRIMDEIDAYEGDHEWCPVYEWIDGVSDEMYPTQSAAMATLGAAP